ncbi:hypothetical protein GCM10009799_29700 [Nocardiopsis rhodophaea]|uniref:Carrier domain-containing protein n=1 Tax=Nocardiopsis rhodophaea TaxID=280238 RepID=A0ABN2T6W0_9ACTN
MTAESGPTKVSDIYPLSPAQQGVLFHTLSAPASGVYFEQFSVRLEGKLDTAAFRAAWEHVVHRHDVLRAALQWEGLDQPLMVVFDQVDLPWSERDWRDMPAEDQQDRMQRSLAEQRVSGFDLASAPLLRVEVIRLDDAVWQVVWSFHHIVLDGWSSAAVLRELFTAYAALLRGTEPKLPPVRPYRDYIGWLQEQDLAAAEGYWRDLLAGVSGPTSLAIDRPADGFRGDDEYGRLSHPLPAGLVARIEATASALRLTANTLFQAAWSLLLSRYAGTDDVVYGVTSSGRPADLTGVENITGMFINTLPTRVRVPGDRTVEAWLQEVQEAEHERRRFEFSPLYRVQEWSGVPSGAALFESILVFENYPADASVLDDVPELRVAEMFGIEQTNYPLTVLVEMGERARLDVWFDRTRIGEDAGRRLLGHLGRALEELTGAPDRPVAEIGLLTDEEQREFADWGATDVGFGTPECLHEAVVRQARRTPEAIAVRCEGVELTYAELDRQSNRLAHTLASRDAAGRVVGLLLDRSVDLVVAMLAVFKSGGAYLPLAPDQPTERLEFMIGDSEAALVLMQNELRHLLPTGTLGLAVDGDWDSEVAPHPDTALGSTVRPSDLAYVMYTSGSTGEPKGVMVEHRGVWNRLVWGRDRFPIGPGDTVLQKTPYTFDVSVWEFLWPLMTGARLVLARPDGHRDPDYLVDLIREEEVTTLHFVPSMLRYFLAAPGVEDLPLVRRVFCSGEALTPDLRDRFFELFDAELHNLYGPTEASIEVTHWECLPGQRGESVVPIGRPIANMVCRILDPQGRQVPVGVPGELHLGGIGLARGYLARPELTRDRFVPDPYADSDSEARLYRTGDLARWRPDGVIEYLGRNDDQIKIRGQRVEPGEIEAALLAHPDVGEAAIAVYGDDARQRIAAYVAAAPGGRSVDRGEIRAHAAQRLPEYMVPAAVTVLDRFPISANGKLDRAALPQPAWQEDAEFVPADTSMEQTLAMVCADVLGVDRVGVLDNFFALGGDSILSIQMVSRAAQHGIHITPAQVFREQTVERLVRVAGSGPAVLAPQGPVTGPVALGPVQRWFFRLDLAEPNRWNQGVTLVSPTDLDPDLVRRALLRVLTHHDVLRSRFVRDGGQWGQHQVEPGEADVPVAVVDGSVDDALRLAHSRLDLGQGPLLRAAIAGRSLVIACHHLVVDAVSWRFVVEDFEGAYVALSRGRQVELPAKTTAFAQWTERLAEYAESAEVVDKAPYWRSVLDTVRPLPPDVGAPGLQGEAVRRRISLPTDATAALADAARRMKARLDELVLAAFAQGLTSWTGEPDVTVDVEGHGREPLFDDVDLSRTVGWFTAIRPVHLAVGGRDPVEAVRETKRALRSAPDGGIGFGLLREHTDLLENAPIPLVLFNFLGRLDQAGPVQDPLFSLEDGGAEAAIAPDDPRHHAIEINAAVQDGRLVVDVAHPGAPAPAAAGDRLLTSVREALDRLAAPDGPSVHRAHLPSDFPLASVDEEELARIAADPAPVADLYPATAMQQGLLFHTLSAPDSGVYFEQFTVRVEGELDTAVLRSAWEHLLNRHEALRSAVLWDGVETPMTVVYDRVELPWAEEDWRGCAPADRDGKLTELLAGQRREGFDPSRAPLLRAGAIRLDDSVWQLVWNFHHIVLDGWSSATVLRELFEAYVALQAGRVPELPQVRPYRDHVEWLQGQDLAAAEGYWRDLLSDVTEASPLGMDRRAEAGRRDEDYDRMEDVLPADLCARLEETARRRRLTVNTLFQGAWSLLLSRYAGSEDVVYGVTSSGRPADLAGAEGIVGLFINTLPARVACPDGEELGAWLGRLQQSQIDQRRYDFTPLNRVQEWSGVPAGSPLFESILVFENYPADFSVLDQLSELRVAELHSTEQTNYPLTAVIVPGARTRVKLWFDRTRIDPGAAEGLLGHMHRLLEEMCGTPGRRLGDVDMLTDAERGALAAWTDTAREYGSECPHHAVSRQAEATPEAVALRFGDRELSYAELDERSERLARHLRERGVAKGAVVGLCLHRSVELVVGLLGVLKAGAAYLPLSPDDPVERLAYLLGDTDAALVLTQGALRDGLPDTVPVLALDTDAWGADVPAGSAQEPERCGTPSDLAYVMYTSGSTGEPKGVMVEHRGVWNRLRWMQDAFPIGPGDTVLQKTPYTFDVSVWEFLWPLMTGARLVLARPDGHRDPDYLVDLIREEEVTTLHFVPSMLRYFLAAPGVEDLPSVRRVFCSGEAFPPDLRDRFFELFDAELHNLYGPTEASIDVTAWECRPEQKGEPVVPIGRPIANMVCRILDPQGRQVPVGVPGELHLGGVGLARGYLARPELTRERFVPDPYGEPGSGARLYRTGDVARWRPDGVIEYLGRNDDQIKIRGQRVEPGEIEAVLRSDPMVKQAVVVAGSRGGEGTVLSAFAEPDIAAAATGDADSTAYLRRHVERWQSLYEEVYSDPVVEDDPDFNTAGWISSYTGRPIPTEEMREWRDRTVQRILDLRPDRVLEIGCGTGILLTRIAPECSSYRGTDMSATALDYVRERVTDRGLDNVLLEKGEAVDFDGIPPESADVVVLNSVVQYFPSTDYLLDVIRGAMDALAPGGHMVVGDVRNLLLLATLHGSVQLAGASEDTPAGEIVRQVRHLAGIENELLVDPRFFTRLREEIPGLGRIEVAPKAGDSDNELTRFRYDVVLEKAAAPPTRQNARWTGWEQAGLTPQAVEDMIRTSDRQVIALAKVPNARVQRHHERWRRLLAASGDTTVGEALGELGGEAVGNVGDAAASGAVDPERLRAVGRSCGYDVELSWASGYPDGSFDAVLRAPGGPRTDFLPPGGPDTDAADLANTPLSREIGADVRGRLQDRLARTLPAFMVPSALTIVDAIPMTTSGKVDRGALLAGRSGRDPERPYRAPRDEVELRLTRIWESVLDTARVGIGDDFFELGGDSLVAIRLTTEVQSAFGVALQLADQLAARTVEQSAEVVRRGGEGIRWRPLVQITPGEGSPLFCVHPAGGSVLCYGELARRLGHGRPLYGLAPIGLEEGQEADTRVDDMVERYLAEVREVRPHGPYHLAGWSLGGVIALEMAARLRDAGEQVALVAMVDSVAPELAGGDVDDADVLREFFGDIPLDTGHLRTLDTEAAIGAALEQAAEAGAVPVGLDRERLLRMRKAHQRHISALAAHRPTAYDGDVVLFRAEDTDVALPGYGWERVLPAAPEVIEVPGDHRTVLEAPNVQRIAWELAARIAKSEEKRRA